MSEFGLDLTNVLNLEATGVTKVATQSTNKKAGSDLDMNDFLNLMVASLKNQSIDDAVDTSEMMNQMVQMSVMQTISNLTELLNTSTSLTYAASLVGKEVTVGKNTGGKNLAEIVGTVTGTGQVGGEQVIFLDGGESYYLSDIMAVGRLPERMEEAMSAETGSGSTVTASSVSKTAASAPTAASSTYTGSAWETAKLDTNYMSDAAIAAQAQASADISSGSSAASSADPSTGTGFFDANGRFWPSEGLG